MWRDNECEHGSSGYCGICVHEGEYHGGKTCDCGPKEPPKSFEDCMSEDDDHHC